MKFYICDRRGVAYRFTEEGIELMSIADTEKGTEGPIPRELSDDEFSHAIGLDLYDDPEQDVFCPGFLRDERRKQIENPPIHRIWQDIAAKTFQEMSKTEMSEDYEDFEDYLGFCIGTAIHSYKFRDRDILMGFILAAIADDELQNGPPPEGYSYPAVADSIDVFLDERAPVAIQGAMAQHLQKKIAAGETLTDSEARYAAELVQSLEEPWLQEWFESFRTKKENA